MLGRKQSDYCGHNSRSRRSRASVHIAARYAVCETLERRQLLTQFTFDVPQNEGYTSVYLRAGAQDGWVRVYKNNPTGTPVWEFRGDNDNGTGLYIVDAGGLSNFLFVDQVSAANKPTGTPGTPSDNGILVKASTVSSGNEGHLKIEATAADELIRIVESTSSGGTVEIRPHASSGDIGNSRFGTGVNQLTIQTDSSGDAKVRVGTQEPQPLPPPPPPVHLQLPGLHPGTALRIESLGPRDEIALGGADNASVAATVRTGKGNNRVVLLQDGLANGTTTALVDFDPTLSGGGLGAGIPDIHRSSVSPI